MSLEFQEEIGKEGRTEKVLKELLKTSQIWQNINIKIQEAE